MKEIRIEKVTNGYIVRCFGGEGHNSYDDTFVYPNILQVTSFMAMQMNEPEFEDRISKLVNTENSK